MSAFPYISGMFSIMNTGIFNFYGYTGFMHGFRLPDCNRFLSTLKSHQKYIGTLTAYRPFSIGMSGGKGGFTLLVFSMSEYVFHDPTIPAMFYFLIRKDIQSKTSRMVFDLFVRFLWLYIVSHGNVEEMGFRHPSFWRMIRIFTVMYPLMYEAWYFAITRSVRIKNQKNGTIS